MRNSRLLSLFVLLLCLVCIPGYTETATKMPAPTGYIDDYAGVLSTLAKDKMEALCHELHDKTRAQVFVVTINTLENASVEQFANDLFHTWKIGEKKTDRGVLLLFALKEHKYRFEVGYGLEGLLNDAKVGDMGRAIVPELQASDYDNALSFGLNQVAQAIADDSKVELDALKEPEQNPGDNGSTAPPANAPDASSSPDWNQIGLFAFAGAMILTIVGAIIWSFRKGFGGVSSTDTSDGSSYSSDSSSSSSDSFSGGDGGDSGGGGASGDW